MKLAVIGSRTFNDYDLVKSTLDNHKPSVIISGGAKGADSLAKRYAIQNNIELIEIIPDWDKYGRAAGPIRNKEIVNQAEKVIAFWDGKSKGTKSAIDYANKCNKEVVIIRI